jgi:hypothetical protein
VSTKLRRLACASVAVTLLLVLQSAASAKGDDFDAVVRGVRTTCGGKRVRIPFLGLAGFATKLVRPAGVKSFKLAVFEDVRTTGDVSRLGQTLNEALGAGWRPLVRARSDHGAEQFYVFIGDAGENLKLMIVALEDGQATVIRAKINPEALARFAQDPKILGVPLDN